MTRSRLAPASLRGRVRLAVVGLLAVLLVLLFVAVDLALKARLDADLRTRLTDRVALAEQLSGSLDPQELADQLDGDGVLAGVPDRRRVLRQHARGAGTPRGS